MSQLCRGRIVWVELLDPQGRNPNCRPAIIVTPDDDIREDGEVWVVAISTQLNQAPAEVQVELPWHRSGHPRTKLKERCAAICTWLEKVSVANIRGLAGTVPGRQLLEILTRIKLPDAPAPSAPETNEPNKEIG
ncbi:MAG TPA: type II toxin-antitoxin system PemK/MazF family toxin [Gemmataceae bacterium]|nr:type II toxin-antitoxin system PemK/MazF family toxin [Gemmataceae bacterium]